VTPSTRSASRSALVLHDIGGPIGIEWAGRHPDRVLSLTILNSPVRVGSFRRPWPMHPFAIRGVGEVWLRLMRRPFWSVLFRSVGLGRQGAMTNAEINAYLTLLKRVDGGKMFLRIMRGFELTAEKERQLLDALRTRTAPARIIWGRDDRMLGRARLAEAQDAVRPEATHLVPGRHFLQEDSAEEIADCIGAAAVGGHGRRTAAVAVADTSHSSSAIAGSTDHEATPDRTSGPPSTTGTSCAFSK
jgi:pimeloyl-ACP methyl ester carboxylesterase